MPGPAFTEGDTVSLHPIEEEDYEFIQRGRNDPSTRVTLGDTSIRRREDVAELFEEGAEYHFLVCVDEGEAAEGGAPTGESRDPEPVGVVAFGWVRDDVRIGSLMYWIAPEHRREGYVTEGTALLLDYAFAERNFNKVNANVVTSNEASIRTLESLGFEREGHQRRECFVDGEWEDMFTYGLLADEWLDASDS
ncbi:GNAT family N-acetyltransferase [Halobacterium zhouii]|uniref:GNAT family N-acetyltransferase n=1 Tax=Halobacterium zhouii TaxID=2902624 RepID=UPI001E58A250|nr:GNAT family protein [Halobacterium zhouii]